MFRSEQVIQAQAVLTVADLGLDARVGVDKAVFAFLDRSEAIASRWVQLPTGVLLFVTVPDDPHSGGIYLFDRRKGVFYLLDFDQELNGQLTGEDYERLVREHRLLTLVRRPWHVRSILVNPKTTAAATFACCAAIG